MRQLKAWTAALSLPLFLSGCALFGTMKLTTIRPADIARITVRELTTGVTVEAPNEAIPSSTVERLVLQLEEPYATAGECAGGDGHLYEATLYRCDGEMELKLLICEDGSACVNGVHRVPTGKADSPIQVAQWRGLFSPAPDVGPQATPPAAPAGSAGRGQTAPAPSSANPDRKTIDLSGLGGFANGETTLLANTPAGGLYSSVLRGEAQCTGVYLLGPEKASLLYEREGIWSFEAARPTLNYPHILFTDNQEYMEGDSPWDKYANAVFVFRTGNPLFTCYLEKPCVNIVMLPPS